MCGDVFGVRMGQWEWRGDMVEAGRREDSGQEAGRGSWDSREVCGLYADVGHGGGLEYGWSRSRDSSLPSFLAGDYNDCRYPVIIPTHHSAWPLSDKIKPLLHHPPELQLHQQPIHAPTLPRLKPTPTPPQIQVPPGANPLLIQLPQPYNDSLEI